MHTVFVFNLLFYMSNREDMADENKKVQMQAAPEGYDPTLIGHWKNGIPYTRDGYMLLPTLHVTATDMPSDNILNLIAGDVCAVCGRSDCPHRKKEKAYRDIMDAYQKGDFNKLRRVFLVSYAGHHQYETRKNEALDRLEKEWGEASAETYKDSVKFTSDFYKEVFKLYGEKAENLAKLLADQAKGKNIRSVEDALKAYDKHKANINKKINAKDREAIAKALESVKVGDIAEGFKKFSKGLGYASYAIDFADWGRELINAVRTDNWRPFFVKTESLAVGMAASAIAGYAFSAILGGPVGILGYGLIMAGIGALVNDGLVERANSVIGI